MQYSKYNPCTFTINVNTNYIGSGCAEKIKHFDLVASLSIHQQLREKPGGNFSLNCMQHDV